MGRDRMMNESHIGEAMSRTEEVAVEEGIKEYELDLMTGMPNNSDKEIKEESPAEVETTGPETINGVIVHCINVKVRKKASTESDPVEILRVGDKVHIHRQVKDFYEVDTSINKRVYILKAFVRQL